MSEAEDMLRGAIGSMLGACTDEEIDNFVQETSRASLGASILATRAVRKRAERAEALLENRYGRECPEVYKAPDGSTYVFREDRHRNINDPVGLLAELDKVVTDPVGRYKLKNAYRWKREIVLDQNILNWLYDHGKKEVRAVIRDFRDWAYGVPHLTLLEKK
jgi:hypothetical protein